MLRDQKKKLIYLLIFLIPFFLFFILSRAFIPVKFKVVQIFALPIRILSLPIREVKKMIFYHRTFEEYKKLKAENDTLKSRLVDLEELIRENTRLEQLLAFKRKLIYSSVTGNVVGRNPSSWNSSVIIDKGSVDGIKQGQSVVVSAGVLGKVVEASRNYSKVLLLIDPEFSVAAIIQRTRETGVVSGTLQGVCRMKYINPSADIQVGDKVMTSKLSTAFPEGLLIGEVVNVEYDPVKPSLECVIKPSVALSQIEEVLVILK